MKKPMFLFVAMFFVLAMSASSAIGAPFLKWDVLQDGIFEQELAANPGETFVVDLWVTDIPSPGASSFEVDMKYDTNVLKINSVTVNNTDWMLPYTDWTSVPGRISAGGSAPQGIGYTGDVKLITIEFECKGGSPETFDFTESAERFYLGKLGAGEFDVDKETYALTVICSAPDLNIDVDKSGDVRPLTDGLLITRYLFGSKGNNLASGAVDPNGYRTNAFDIADWIERERVEPSPTNDNYVHLDVDQNGEVTALTDGIMILRYLFGYTGTNLTAVTIGPNAKRTDPSAISGYIDSLK